ncbi:MAG: tyrosine-type recombinase/integrase, partial [Acidithiobacillus sp.]|nr:tyrosine-type recombinase/integrase [Acidithiobacillus sp.]
RLRDQTGVCNGLRQEQRPSFHEIRALGAELYRQAGWTDDAIQRLLGHSTEKMTKHYLDKHQEPWIVTDTVGLSLMVYQK